MTKQNITLKAELRKDEGGKFEKLNPQEFIPAIIYGAGKENKCLKIKAQDFYKAYDKAGESNLIDLQIGDDQETSKIIIKDLQKDVVKDFIIHVDFYEVDMTKEITTEISLEFVGESKAVRELGAELIKNMYSVEVSCLPGDLVDHIDVDISSLENFEDVIRLDDIKIPEGMELTSEGNETIISAREPRAEEEPEPEAEVGAEEGGAATPTEGEAEKEGEAAEVGDEEKK